MAWPSSSVGETPTSLTLSTTKWFDPNVSEVWLSTRSSGSLRLEMVTENNVGVLVTNRSQDLAASILGLAKGTNASLSEASGVEVTARDETLVVWEIVTLLAIFVLTVFGNVVVLMLLVRHKKLTRMCYFILSLCVSDLITAFFNVLPQMVWEVTYRFRGGDFLCKTVKFGQLLGPYLNSYLLVMTALDRYQVICNPLSSCAWSPRRSKNMIYLAWVLALGSCTPQLFVFSYQEVRHGTWDCWASFIPPWGPRAYVTWYALSVFIVPLVFLIFAYSCICRTLWVNFKLKQMDDHAHRCHDSRRPHLLVRLRSQRNRNDAEISTCIHDPPSQENIMPLLNASTPTPTPTPHSLRAPNGLHAPSPQPPRLVNPRAHSIRSISRAKIKTVKLTVTVIFCYVSCSAPFISVQLWHVWDPNAASSPFYNGDCVCVATTLDL